MSGALRNWIWVYAGNLIGSLAYAVLFYLAITGFGTSNGAALGDQLRKAAQAKTLAYQALGPAGWGTAFVKAMLCNWMVTLGAVLALISRSTIGKDRRDVAADQHVFRTRVRTRSIVNMFVVPAGRLLGAPVPVSTWWVWNQIPVTLGNLSAGVLFTGVALYAAYPQRSVPPRPDEDAAVAFMPSAGVDPV